MSSTNMVNGEMSQKYVLFQESARKSLERVFGVLFNVFKVLNDPSRFRYSEEMYIVLKACCIFKNMFMEEHLEGFIGDVIGDIRDY